MGWWDDNQDNHNQVYNDEPRHHEGKFSHEVIGGAVGFEAMKAYEDHERREGKPVSHAFAKEVLAGLATAGVDKLVESKGMDWVDAEKAKHHAKQNAERMYDERYQSNDY
ncbi:hypothetical protein Egran_05932 [Elaphomyces granulatus]|uniref:CipC-like antibiotic response protein n=1 Tax=Elaphomyces granulatus TaxID=519963 RepID=A0A232LQ51_9EURO|nr:hypothetical protein Egran_05932 [Elaphomyces granulatus]